MTNIAIISSILALLSVSIIIYLLRKNILYSRYTPWWVFVVVAILVFGFFPNLSDELGEIFGVSYGPILVLVIAIIFIFTKILFMDIERSKQETRIRRLVQEVAMLRNIVEKKDD